MFEYLIVGVVLAVLCVAHAISTEAINARSPKLDDAGAALIILVAVTVLWPLLLVVMAMLVITLLTLRLAGWVMGERR